MAKGTGPTIAKVAGLTCPHAPVLGRGFRVWGHPPPRTGYCFRRELQEFGRATRVHGPWFMVHDSWFMVHGSWFMVHGSWFMVYGS